MNYAIQKSCYLLCVSIPIRVLFDEQNCMEEPKKHGGRRIGAGRPKKEKGKKNTTFRLDTDLEDYLSKKTNKSEFINSCIRERKERESKTI